MDTYPDSPRSGVRTGAVSVQDREAEYAGEERYARARSYRFWIDRVRWGPVWAGLVVALSTYLLIQLALVATDAVDLADPSTSDAVLSGIAAAVGFFLGGLVVGATAMWRGIEDGILHGIVLWAAGLVALIVLATVGGGIALGSVDTSDAFEDIQAQADTDPNQANEDAQDAAGRAFAVIVAALVASAAGGAAGAKLWPRRDDDIIDLRSSRQRVDSTVD